MDPVQRVPRAPPVVGLRRHDLEQRPPTPSLEEGTVDLKRRCPPPPSGHRSEHCVDPRSSPYCPPKPTSFLGRCGNQKERSRSPCPHGLGHSRADHGLAQCPRKAARKRSSL